MKITYISTEVGNTNSLNHRKKLQIKLEISPFLSIVFMNYKDNLINLKIHLLSLTFEYKEEIRGR